MHKTLLLAHRGFSGLYPENSPLSFQKAVEATDCDGFESDVHLTRDGRMVIFHDDRVDRTSNGHGFIRDHTYEELLQLDIGAWKDPAFAGQHIWTFEQLLDFCRDTGKVLNIELKNYSVFYEGLEQRVIDAICSRHMEQQVFASSFNHVSMQLFKQLCPDIRTGLLYEAPLVNMANYLNGSNADNVHPCHLLLDYQPELLELFHSRGMRVNTWTVNEEADMKRLLARGVDGIITNYPDVLCRAAENRG